MKEGVLLLFLVCITQSWGQGPAETCGCTSRQPKDIKNAYYGRLPPGDKGFFGWFWNFVDPPEQLFYCSTNESVGALPELTWTLTPLKGPLRAKWADGGIFFWEFHKEPLLDRRVTESIQAKATPNPNPSSEIWINSTNQAINVTAFIPDQVRLDRTYAQTHY